MDILLKLPNDLQEKIMNYHISSNVIFKNLVTDIVKDSSMNGTRVHSGYIYA